jgi:hypothetical protein
MQEIPPDLSFLLQPEEEEDDTRNDHSIDTRQRRSVLHEAELYDSDTDQDHVGHQEEDDINLEEL